MTIETTHHIDSSDEDQEGGYEWYYEYHLFRFTEGTLTFIARSYVHSPGEAHFLSLQEGKKIRSLLREHLDLPLFQQAASHLRDSGRSSINWLASCGYEPV